MVKRRTRDREVPGSIPTNCKCCFLEQETLSTLLSTGFYPGKKRATWKISTRLLNVLPSINKVDYYYYYYFGIPNTLSREATLSKVFSFSSEWNLLIRKDYDPSQPSRKHAYIILTPPPPNLNPIFYIVKLGFTGVNIIFSYFAKKHRLWELVRTASLRRF